MATCPRCKGHLTEDHLCPRGATRSTLGTALAAVGGGLIALLIFSLLDPKGELTMDGVVIVGGALVGVGLDRWLRG
jgi:hypothetical protein